MIEGSEQQIHIDQAFLDDLTKKHEEAFESTLKLKDSPEWKFKKKDGDLQIYVRKDPIEKFDQIMSVISMPYTTEEIMSKIRPLDLIDESTPKNERHGIARRKILWEKENDPDHEALIVYICMETPVAIVAKRDLLVYRRRYEKDGRSFFMHTSFDNDDIMKPVPGNVRSKIYFQLYIVEDDPKVPGNKLLWFICQANPMGSIPAWVYNIIVATQAENPKIIKDQIKADHDAAEKQQQKQ